MLADPSRRPELARPVLHPQAGEAWFRALPHERRARMNREYREGLARDRALASLERGRPWTGAWKQALVFGVFDLICPLGGSGSFAVALLVGGALGALLHAARADRIVTALGAGFAFVILQLVSRGGLTPLTLFWIVPATVFSAFLGYEREE